MSVLNKDIVIYGCANHQETDSGTQGGAVDKTIKLTFKDRTIAGGAETFEVFSESGSDTTQTITITGRDSAGAIVNEVETLTGQTPAATAQTFERILHCIKSATTVGRAAVLSTTTHADSGTAQGGANDATVGPYITVEASPTGTAAEHRHRAVRTTGGTGPNQVREIVLFDVATERAYVNEDWDVVPSSDTTYEITDGCVFDDLPTEVLEIRRPFYNAAAEASGGSEVNMYEKGFIWNKHATLALTNATVTEVAGGVAAQGTFWLAATLDDTDTSTNRITAPGGSSFDSGPQDVANSQSHTQDTGQGIWFKLTLAAGTAANNDVYTIQEDGQST